MYCQIMEFITIFQILQNLRVSYLKIREYTRPVGQVSDVNHGPLVLKITYIKS